jgi:hypothetical protein
MLIYLIIGKNLSKFVCASKGQSTKKLAKVKRTREEMLTTFENIKKALANSSKSALKRKNKVEEGGALVSRMKREHESIYLKAQKIMRGKVEPFAVPIVVRAMPTVVRGVPIVVHVVKQTTEVPHMTFP